MSATHDLATLQRGLLGLIKGTHHVTEADEPYLQVVAHSDELALVREIATWWRAFSLERYCVLTVALLKRRGIFDEAVSTFIREHTISPFIETLSRAFLRALSTHADGLVATVAQFELALIQVKHGDPTHYTIEWAYEPYTVLQGLLTGASWEEARAQGRYCTMVSRDYPKLFEVLHLQTRAGTPHR